MYWHLFRGSGYPMGANLNAGVCAWFLIASLCHTLVHVNRWFVGGIHRKGGFPASGVR